MTSIRSRLIKLCLRPEQHSPQVGTASTVAGLIGRLITSHAEGMAAEHRGQILEVDLHGQKFLIGVLPLSPSEANGEEVLILETSPQFSL